MVWVLIPIDSLRGAQKYYIFSKGTYKVGRKDCNVIVQTDTSVSRVHAEIFVDKMASWNPSHSGSASFPSHVRVVDRSKYGTVINKELGAKGTCLRKDQEATIKDGDTITFGTGNATFRFCFVPLIIFLHCSKPNQVDPSLRASISSVGACTTFTWSRECTHVLVEESSQVTPVLIEAVAAKKTIVLSDWFEVLAERNIHTEIPSCTPYVPNLSLEGTLVKVVEPKVRENLLEAYTFVLGSSDKYKFGDEFQSLLEMVGANCLHVDEFCSSSQTLADGENDQLVLVVPAKSINEFNHSRELSSLSRVSDMKLIAAVMSGHLEPSVIEAPSFILSSHSTDETIVADSDVEIDTATSDHIAAIVKPQDATKHEYEDKNAEISDDREAAIIGEDKKNFVDYSSASTDKSKLVDTKDEEAVAIRRMDKGDTSFADRHENSDIIYSKDLIVRSVKTPLASRSTEEKVVDFKRFRKRETVSGNSFKDLIPFAKDPYKESDGGSHESEYMREQKKRKQMEAIAEDLFNNEKAMKRAKTGSLYALFSRR